MKIIQKLMTWVLSDNQNVTDELVDYYEKNPEELDLIINKEYFHTLFLSIFFILGITITVSARIISYFYADRLGQFVDSIVLDVLSELGIAIFGGAVVAYLIEFLNKRQYQQNLKFRKEIKRRIEERVRVNLKQ